MIVRNNDKEDDGDGERVKYEKLKSTDRNWLAVYKAAMRNIIVTLIVSSNLQLDMMISYQGGVCPC